MAVETKIESLPDEITVDGVRLWRCFFYDMRDKFYILGYMDSRRQEHVTSFTFSGFNRTMEDAYEDFMKRKWPITKIVQDVWRKKSI